MTTRVELPPKTTRSDLLNEGKPSRSYVSPLSDASNKSSDSNMSSSLIIEETTGVPSKAVNMFNSGMRPRLSPKPFSREKAPENSRLLQMVSALSTDVKPQSNVPFQTSTSISLSSSPKSEEHERVGRRIFTSFRQRSTEEDQVNKSDNFSSAPLRRRQQSLNWSSTATSESRSASLVDEPKVASKPPLMPRKLDISQQQEKQSASSSKNDATEREKERLEKAKSLFQSDSLDSLSVRAQLRPKRRPVSAMFLDSINDQTAESKVVDTEKPLNRRPLSEDLTSLFESRGLGNKTENPSEESKENRPLTRNSFHRSITEDLPDVPSKTGELAHYKSVSSEISGISSRSMFSATRTKVSTEEKSNNQQGKHIVPENDIAVKQSVNSINQVSKVLPDNHDSLTSETKNADDSDIAPGITKRRISLYLANSDSSVDSVDLPTSKEDKNNLNTERSTKGMFFDKDVESGRPRLTSQPQATDSIKTYSTFSSNVEPKSGKTIEERSASAFQDYGVQKEKKDWRTSDAFEEKLRIRRSFKKTEELLQLEDSKTIFNKGKTYVSKDNPYTSIMEDTDNKSKNLAQTDNMSRTVKATMFEHNVERHRPPEVIGAINSTPGDSASIRTSPQRSEVKNTENWSKWLTGDGLNSVTEIGKDNSVVGSRSNEGRGQVASSAEYSDDLQILKTFHEKRCVEPRYEVIQAIGERVLSESIQMAPEDKAVTLRSRRSFHRKEKEFDNSEIEGSAFSRPASSLRRSKSEYRKRDTQEITQESINDKLDFSFRKNKSAEKSEPLKVADMTFDSIENKGVVDSFQQRFYNTDYKQKRENVLDQVFPEKSSFEIAKTEGREKKTYFNDYNWHKNTLFNDSVENSLEYEPKKIIKDEQTLIKLDDPNKSPQMDESDKWSHQRNQVLSDKDLLPIQKGSNTESKDVIGIMSSKEVHQIKKELIVPQAKKEMAFVSSERSFKEEYAEELKWERKKLPFQDKNTSGYGTENKLDTFTSDYDDCSRKQNMPAMKDTSQTDSKATYFAVTGLDNRKVKKDVLFEGQGNLSNSWTSEKYQFKGDSTMDTTYWRSNKNYKSEEKKSEEKNILGDLETPKELKTYRHQKDDYVDRIEKPSENPKVVDVDSLMKRHKLKQDLDAKSSSRSDDKNELKISKTDYRSELGTVQVSPLNLDGSYKSKVVDIDSLMPDYANYQKENITKDNNSNISKSRSFRENTSKGSSKWKDPVVKPFTTQESYKFETVGSWYSSREATSMKEDIKPDQNKSTDILGQTPTDKKYQGKGREDQSFQALPGKGPAIATLDSLLESSKRTRERARAMKNQELPTVTSDRFTSHNVKSTVVEMNVDGHSGPVSDHVKPQPRVSVETTKHLVSEERQPPSEGRRPAKASDLINLMLESREKRKDQHRTRQSLPLEQSQETHRFKYQQEWYYSERKDYSVKEDSRQWTKPQQEQEIGTDLPRRKSINRQRERDLKSEQDHVKQCFSRSSTSNKDTDSLVQDPEQKYGTWSQDKPTKDSCVTESPSYDNSSHKQHSHSRLSSLSQTETDQHDSITEARDVSLDRCSMDSTDGTESTPSFNEAKGSDFPIVEQTSVLDSTALKNRAQLSRKSQRRAPSHMQRRSRLLQTSSQLAVIEDTDNPWMYTDSTEAKPEKKEEVEEEKPQRSSVHSPRMPVFPGMDHSSFMAQLRKRQDAESSSESSPQPKSPKSPLPHGTLGVKLLPTPGDKQDIGAGESPQWLKELKTKKRLSQYENPS